MKTKMTSYIVKLNENRIFFYLFPSDDSLAMQLFLNLYNLYNM